ncbi:hypothetical protein [Porphyromonas loveana]|uniref:hypothetical protein n=1 Tax=Porphyromonas loveana TaxID=1884669 RepID=UPI00359F3116
MIGILLDPSGDLDLSTSKIRLGDVRAQTSQILLEAMPGEIREFPLLGLGVRQILGGEVDKAFLLNAKKQLRHCGIPVSRVHADNQTIIIE